MTSSLLNPLTREERRRLLALLEQSAPRRGTALRDGSAAAEPPPMAPVSRDGPLALSFAQQRLWFLSQLEGPSPAYHIPLGLRLSGRLERGALQRALARIVARHEALRTSFVLQDGQPVQRIAPAEAGFALQQHDLRGQGDAAALAVQVGALASAQALAPFDLAQGPLIRGSLVVLQDEEHVLLLTMHHIVSDGWSMGVLTRELEVLYQAFAQGRDDPLPVPAIQYADYAAWQRQWLQGEELQRQAAYWEHRLAGAPALLELPSDRPRPARFDPRGATVPVELDPALSRALKALGQRHGTTLHMTLLAAWAALLARLSGQHDLVIGTPVANRTRVETEGLIGFFVNTLALRIDLAGQPDTAGLLQRVKAEALAAQDHQDLPFEQVVDLLKPARSLSHSPLFQAMFSWHNHTAGTLALPGLQLQPLPLQHDLAKFDLTLHLGEAGDRIRGVIEYATALHDAATMQRHALYLVTLLQAMVADERRPLAGIDLLGPAERRQQLVAWNPPAPRHPCACLHRLFEAQAARAPQAIALSCGPRALAYGELNAQANRLAHHLRGLGVGPDGRVALCLPRGEAMLVGLLAILKAGGAYVPLDPDYPAERLAWMLEDSAPAAVLAQAGEGTALRSVLHAAGVPVLDLQADAAAWSALPAHDLPDTGETPSVRPNHLAYVIYTSGSTGRPKGVMVEHANVARLLQAAQPHFGFGPQDVWTLFHSFAFDFSVWEIWGALAHGGRLVVVPPMTARSPREFYELLCEQGVTVLNQTPGAFRQLIAAQAGSTAAHRLRQVVFGGEALEAGMLAPWYRDARNRGTQLVNMYGITETTVHVTYWPLEAQAPPSACIGRPLDDLQAYVLDEALNPVPVGVAGELHIGGAGLARGYLNRPELTAQRFIRHPFSSEPGARLYKTGDRARFLADGRLEYLGRIDAQVKIRGFRIELGEIEAALAALPQVREAVVVARDGVGEGEPGGRQLVAYVVPREDGVDPAELRSALARRLPDFMLPAHTVLLDALPLTPHGKLDRRALPAPQGRQDERQHVAPRTPLEAALAAVWAQVLHLERVGVHDNFFAIGGDSIRSITLITRAQEQGLSFAVVDLFTHQTIANLAQAITATAGEPPQDEQAGLGEADRARLPEGIEDAYGITMLQTGLVFHNQASQEAGLYHDVFGYRLRLPAWNEAALRTVLQALARKHPMLRTSFDFHHDSEPLQLVHAQVQIPLTVIDLSAQDPAAQDRAIDAFLAQECSTGFALESAPLLRFFVHLCSDGVIHYTLSFHHAILDGWSAAALQTELFQEYLKLLADPAPHLELAPLAATPRAVVAAERHALASAAHRAFWSRYLDGHQFSALPPRQGAAPAEPPRRSLALVLEADLRGRLAAVAASLGVPIRSVILGAHLRVLAMLSGRCDVTTGLVSNVRQEGADGEKVLGLFLNTLPLRLVLQPGSWAGLIRQTFDAELGVIRHRHYPYFQLYLDNGRAPLYEANFNYINFHVYESLQRSRDFVLLDAQSFEATELPLVVHFSDAAGQFTMRIQVDTARFPAAQADRLAGYYLAVLQSIAADPGADHSVHDFLSDAERRQLLETWNATGSGRDRGQCVHRLFEAQAARTPGAAAVQHGERGLSYRQLNARANRLAHRLLGLGVQPGERVAILLERSIELVVAELAVLKCGAAYVPLDQHAPAQRQAFMLADCGARRVLTTRDQQPPQVEGLQRLDLDELNLGAQPAHDPQVAVAAEAPAYVMYTSGSTGQPKGVVVPHRAIGRVVLDNGYAAFDASDRVAFAANPAFDATTMEVWAPLLNGGCIVVIDAPCLLDAARLAQELQQQRVTALFVTTALFNQYAQAIPQALAGLKYLLCGGERNDPAAFRRVLAEGGPQHLIHCYGPTETTTYALACEIGQVAEGAVNLPIGKPIADTRAYLLDGQGQPVPIGVTGEIHIGGAGVALGYLNRPELTAERFVDDPFHGGKMYRTGDLGRHRADGNIEFVGRNDFQVKIRGFRIEPGEIEAKLQQQPGIREAVVLAREDSPGDRRLVAYYTAQREIGAEELRGQLAAVLPEYMLPAAYVQLAQLPLTPNGKLDRKALLAPAPAAGEAGCVAPRNPAEAALAQIWAEVLKLERVGVHDNFFDIGGDSIRAVSVLSRARKQGIVCAVVDLFTHQTIARLVQSLEARAADEEAAAARQPAGGALPASTLGEADRARLPAGVEDAYGVTLLQTGMVYHNQLSTDAAVYHDVFSYRLTLPAWNEPAFRAVLDALVRKHPALRTSFDFNRYSEPLQLVHAQAQLPVTVADLSMHDGAAQDRLIAQFVEAERKTPIALDAAPLLRVFIHLRGGNVVQYTPSFHHAILDGWSFAALQAELFQQYLQLLADGRTELALAPLAVTPREAAACERRALASPAHRAFWAGHLEGHQFSALPAYEPDAQPAPEQLNLEVPVADAVRAKLNALASRLEVPVRSVLLCAHLRVLSLLSGRSDVTTGLVCNVRLEQADGEKVVGLFLNTLPLRQVLGPVSWARLIRQTFEAELGVIRHREYPYFQIYLDNGRSPLYEVAFNYTNFHVYESLAQVPGFSVVEEHSLEATNFPVIVHVGDTPARLMLLIQAQGTRLSRSQGERMRAAYLSVLEAIAADAEASHMARDFLPLDERDRLLVGWNRTEAACPQERCVHELVEAQARRAPAATALADEGGRRLAYGELNAQANRLARHLRGLGVGPDGRVAVCLPRGIEMVVGLLAVLKAGGAYVPLDPAYPAQRLNHMLADSAPLALLTLGPVPAGLQAPSSVPALDLQADAWQWAARSGEDLPCAETGVAPQHLAYVIYTSGSTGTPKGVAMPHRPLVNLVSWRDEAGGAGEPLRTLQFAALGFDVAFQEIFTTLCAGAELELVNDELRLNFGRLFRHICSRGIERLYLPYMALQHLAEAAVEPDLLAAAGGARCALRRVITAGEQLRITPALTRFFTALPGCRLINHYGPTETHVASGHVLPADPALWPVLPAIGRPIPNARIYLLNAHHQPVPRGVQGELYIGGAAVARGYLNRPELTAERFVTDPRYGGRLYRTGDLARYLPDGSIEFLGRNDFQVKIRGYRIELGEIEAKLAQQPGVREAVVLAREDSPGDKRLVAYYTARPAGEPAQGEGPGAGPDAQALRSALSGQLPGYMVPVAFVRLAQLPLSANGKLDRRALPAPDTQAHAVREYEAPVGKVESALARMWSELLRVEQVGRQDDFFELGGHSLLSVRLITRIQHEFGVRFSLPDLFAHPTLAAMARRLIYARLARFAPQDLEALAAAQGLTTIERAAS